MTSELLQVKSYEIHKSLRSQSNGSGDWFKDEEDTYVIRVEKQSCRMWQQDDTLQAFGEYDTLSALEALWLTGEDRPSSSPRQFPSGVPGGTHLPNGTGDDFQTIQDPLDNVDATAVRKVLRSAQLEQDIVEALISQGGLKSLSLFKFLEVEDLTEKERSIISPKVIPKVQARYLIHEAVPKMIQELKENTQASRPAASSRVSVDASRMIDLHAHDAHDALPDDHMHKHAPPLDWHESCYASYK